MKFVVDGEITETDELAIEVKDRAMRGASAVSSGLAEVLRELIERIDARHISKEKS